MKKTRLKSLLLGALAFTAMTATAQTAEDVSSPLNRIWFLDYATGEVIENIELNPGEELEVLVAIHNETPFSALQFYFAHVEGLVLDWVNENGLDAEDREDNWPTYTDGRRTRQYSYGWNSNTVAYVVDEDGNPLPDDKGVLQDGTMRAVGFTMQGADAAFQPGEGPVVHMIFVADENFKGGEILLLEGKGDYSPVIDGVSHSQKFTMTDQHVCTLTVAPAATPLADIVAQGVDETEYTVAEDLKVVAVVEKDNSVIVSDGQGNWMKVAAEGEVFNAIKGLDCIKGGTLAGTLSNANQNQTLTITEAPEDGVNVVTVDIATYDLAQSDPDSPNYKFAPKVNEVININGYYSKNDNALRGYSNLTGQSATINLAWCETPVEMQNATYYNLKNCVAQIKAPWDAEDAAPARVKASDALSFQNYTIYPLSINAEDILTGVENLKAGQNVVSVEYVNAAGQVSTTPFTGVNMVVTRYSDGSQVTTKVVK